MLRAFAMLIVFFGCAFLGSRASSGLRLRRDTLRAMIGCINRLSIWMEYAQEPLSTLARRAKSEETAIFWDTFSKKLKNAGDVELAWQQAMEYAREQDAGFAALENAELNALYEYAQGLGKSDGKSQAKNAALLQQWLEELCTQAQAAYGSKGRMYRSVGILTGLAAAILLW